LLALLAGPDIFFPFVRCAALDEAIFCFSHPFKRAVGTCIPRLVLGVAPLQCRVRAGLQRVGARANGWVGRRLMPRSRPRRGRRWPRERGILKVAALLVIGSGTVQRIKQEMT
jgi:hypothetical protein